jgi:hypothetical protein
MHLSFQPTFHRQELRASGPVWVPKDGYYPQRAEDEYARLLQEGAIASQTASISAVTSCAAAVAASNSVVASAPSSRSPDAVADRRESRALSGWLLAAVVLTFCAPHVLALQPCLVSLGLHPDFAGYVLGFLGIGMRVAGVVASLEVFFRAGRLFRERMGIWPSRDTAP